LAAAWCFGPEQHPTRRFNMFVAVDRNPSPEMLRRWSFITAGMLGCIATFALLLWPDSCQPIVALWLAGVVLAAGIIGPVVSRPLHCSWMALAQIIATVIGTVTLALVYFLVITPIGVASRLAGRDLLQQRRPMSHSLWKPFDGRGDDPRRQF